MGHCRKYASQVHFNGLSKERKCAGTGCELNAGATYTVPMRCQFNLQYLYTYEWKITIGLCSPVKQ